MEFADVVLNKTVNLNIKRQVLRLKNLSFASITIVMIVKTIIFVGFAINHLENVKKSVEKNSILKSRIKLSKWSCCLCL